MRIVRCRTMRPSATSAKASEWRRLRWVGRTSATSGLSCRAASWAPSLPCSPSGRTGSALPIDVSSGAPTCTEPSFNCCARASLFSVRPIVLGSSMQIHDGWHRLFAAFEFLGEHGSERNFEVLLGSRAVRGQLLDRRGVQGARGCSRSRLILDDGGVRRTPQSLCATVGTDTDWAHIDGPPRPASPRGCADPWMGPPFSSPGTRLHHHERNITHGRIGSTSFSTIEPPGIASPSIQIALFASIGRGPGDDRHLPR
jgi:hypothetical protein